jgi:hypothetical protein
VSAYVLLRREGWRINQKKTRWNYRELDLQLRNKTTKRRWQGWTIAASTQTCLINQSRAVSDGMAAAPLALANADTNDTRRAFVRRIFAADASRHPPRSLFSMSRL